MADRAGQSGCRSTWLDPLRCRPGSGRFAVPSNKLQSLVWPTLPAAESMAAGLVDEVIAPDQLMSRAQEIARQLARIPPRVYSLTKLALRAEALGRMDQASGPDQAVFDVWAAAETLAHVREYVHRTLGK